MALGFIGVSAELHGAKCQAGRGCAVGRNKLGHRTIRDMRNGVVQCLKPQFGGQLCSETYNLPPEYVQFGKGTEMRYRVEIVDLYNLGVQLYTLSTQVHPIGVHRLLTVKKGYGCVN